MEKKFLGSTGLAKFLEHLYEVFAKVGHTHTKSQISDFPTIPTKVSQLTNDSGFVSTDNDTTYTLTKSGSTITLTGTDGSVQTVEETELNIPVDSELSGDSLNPVQNKVINEAIKSIENELDDIALTLGNNNSVYVQSEEPENAPAGSVWVDTDDQYYDFLFELDKTLAAEGMAPDSKAVGEAIESLAVQIEDAGSIDINLDNSNEGEASNINADTLGGKLASEYATQDFVTTKIAEAQLSGEDSVVDLSGYATKDDVSTVKSESVTEAKTYTNEQVKKASPRNLLDNAYWRVKKLIVNQIGKDSYSGAVNCIDRWFSWDSSNITEVKDGYISVSAQCVQLLPVNLFVAGKHYTVVLYGLDGSKHIGTGVYAVSTGIGIWDKVWVDFADFGTAVYLRPGNWVCAALYEGEYTIDTLPEYQPKGYENELLVCRQYEPSTGEYIGLRKFGQPRNLLDNSDFINPVEQAGRNGLHGTKKYAIDRWITEPGSNAQGVPGGDLVLVSDKTNWVAGITQHVDTKLFKRNKVYTFAVYGYIPNACRLLVYNGDNVFGVKYFSGNAEHETYCIMTFNIPDTFTGNYVRCMISPDTDMTGNTIYLKWAAIYEGEYTIDTLPEYQPKGYGAELAECQRYYLKTEQPTAVAFPSGDGTGIRVAIKLPVTMRYSPSIVDCRLGWVMWAGSGYYQGTLTEAISKYGGSTDEIVLLVNVGADTITRIGTANPIFAMMNWISLSAEEM